MPKNNFDIQALLNKGYALDEKTGTLSPPKIETPYIKQQKALNEGLVVKEKINDTPNFTAKINTEWFITYNVPSKKNSKRIIQHPKTKRTILIPSELHEAYKKLTAMQYQVFGIEFRRAVKFYGLEYPLKVEFTYIRGSKHRFDYTNATDTIFDLFTFYKWIEDDSADHIIPSFKPYEYDKQNPGVRIRLITK